MAALFVIALGAPAVADASPLPTSVNPDRTPIVVHAEVPELQAVQMRVSDARGIVLARSPEQMVLGPVTLRWSGGGGPDGLGPVVPDGRYRLDLVAASSGEPLAVPVTVRIDRTPPRVALAALASPTGPRSAAVRVVVREKGSPLRTTLRLRVTELSGRPIATGRWRAAAARMPLPKSALARGRQGAVMVVAEARDAAGNRAHSTPVPVVVAPGPGPARVVSRVITRRRVVALTVDDGYRPDVLARMLGILERERATATFCLNGAAVASYGPGLIAHLRRAARSGRALPCDHGWSHGTNAGTSEAAARADMSHATVARAFGLTTAPFYRPPYGAFGQGIMRAASALGYRDVLLWSIDTNDWRGRSPAEITGQVVREARPGSIILLHVLPQSATALTGMIRGLRARGLEPVSMGELISSGVPTRGGW